jgi:KaiC/GvpD/RAD55 family RecA-like ATPase
MAVHDVHAVGVSLRENPSRAMETATGTAGAVDLVLNVTGASLATTYQFTWIVTDPSGNAKNHQNQTTAVSTSFLLSSQYPRDFGTTMTLAGNYSVAINQNMPGGATNPVATGVFQVGLTDNTVYQRTSTVTIKAAGYGTTERVNINIYRGLSTNSAPGYPSHVTADSSGQVSTSWVIPVNVLPGLWTVSLTGTSTIKTSPDLQTFTVNPINVTLSQLSLAQTPIERTQTQSISFTANYQGGATVQTGSAQVRLTPPSGPSLFTLATYNSTAGDFQAAYVIPASIQTGSWLAAVDPGNFNDSWGNTGPEAAIIKAFTVWPTNVTIPQLTVGQTNLQRSQSESFSFSASYLYGGSVQTGSATIKLTETDGTTFFTTTAAYDSGSGLYLATTKIPISSQAGAWVASIDPNTFNDGYGNGGPATSVVRAFSVQPATLTVMVSVSDQTYGLGQVIPIYATVTYPDGSRLTNGTVTVSFKAGGTSTGSQVTLSYVQGQSRWAGSYVVQSTDLSGLWLATINAGDPYGNIGQQVQSVVVSVPGGSSSPPSLLSQTIFWALIAGVIFGAGGSSLLLVRRFNSTPGSFDQLYSMLGGELSPSTILMFLGDTGTGTTTLSLELVYRHLLAGKPAGFLAYDAFPQEIQRTMVSFGWYVSNYVKNGSLKILDCYSGLAGIEGAEIRDPVDFTEISIKVTQMMEEAGEGPFLLVLDSLAPIFNGIKPETTINFLRVLAAKVKNKNGIFIITGAKGSIPQTVRSALESLLDGVVELNVFREGKRFMRTLTVRRISGRMAYPVPQEFEIASGQGILFRKPRIPLGFLMPRKKSRQL